MLLQRSDGKHNPPPCGYSGDSSGKTPRTARYIYGHGHFIDDAFPGWDAVLAFMIRDHVTAIRDGDRLIVVPLHWAQTSWGRA
jgi:hypothetical protein